MMKKNLICVCLNENVIENYAEDEYWLVDWVSNKIVNINYDLYKEDWLKLLKSCNDYLYLYDNMWKDLSLCFNTILWWEWKWIYMTDDIEAMTEYDNYETYLDYIKDTFEYKHWFFEWLINSKIDEDKIISLWQFCLEQSVSNINTYHWLAIRTEKDRDQTKSIVYDTLNEMDLYDYSFIFELPLDLMKYLKEKFWDDNKQEFILIWWDETRLKEIELLLKLIWYKNIKVESKFCY